MRLDKKVERDTSEWLVDRKNNMAVEFLDAQFALAHIVAQLVVMFDIAAKHPHQIIDSSADLVAFQNFVAFADRRQEPLEIGFAVVFKDDLDEEHH